ncbi:hypothetical protein H310_00404 [Aphanomyces invadans]|uniref:Uncharacterized protein n=1 Tax=Aphanomyces invadans TaxID=157072 RepID=A0A024UWH5_9STRA|nr:hypothetical protein H310_00404 [Aphanomyces invadans]ETW09993.1 hypothetical protein H310_00404 [Aphanomyces invadans]|eukprot:XP_008861404.1 hypothetical protein H310_00404 [Aphanomyces invadans]
MAPGRESSWHRLEKRLDALEEGFRSLSEVVLLEFDDGKATLTFELEKVAARFRAQERLIAVLESQCNRMDTKFQQHMFMVEKKLDSLQTQVTRVSVAVLENEAERTRMNANVDQLLSRESEYIRKHHAIQANQDQMGEWLQKLKNDSTQVHALAFTMQAEHEAALSSLACDTTVLAKELGTLRLQIKAQTAECLAQLNSFTDALEQQRHHDRDHMEKEVAALRESLQTSEATTRSSIDALIKNSSRVRSAVDEGMSLCTSDIKVLRGEIRNTSDTVRTSLASFNNQSTELQSKVSHLLHAVQSLASILHLTTPILA